jgi:hypothetical protein
MKQSYGRRCSRPLVCGPDPEHVSHGHIVLGGPRRAGGGVMMDARGVGFVVQPSSPGSAPQPSCVSPDIEVSWRARIPSPPAEPSVLILWFNQVTLWFCGEPPQTPHADSGREPLPCIDSCPRLHLAFLVNMRPALDLVRPSAPSSRAYLSLHSSEAPQG